MISGYSCLTNTSMIKRIQTMKIIIYSRGREREGCVEMNIKLGSFGK